MQHIHVSYNIVLYIKDQVLSKLLIFKDLKSCLKSLVCIFVMLACPASFFTIPNKSERFPTSGNDIQPLEQSSL
jgi:hypothetical protein